MEESAQLTDTADQDGVRQEETVVDFVELELVSCEPVGHLRLTFIPNESID